MPKPDKTQKKELPKFSKEKLEDLPISVIIRAFNEELVSSKEEEEKVVAWEEGKDDDDPKGGGGHLVRLDKELHMARLILLEKTKNDDAQLDSKFLIALVKLLSKSENAVGWYGEKMKLWRRFLAIMIEKTKQEPISVYSKKESKGQEDELKKADKKVVIADFEKKFGGSP